jgi:hypothetical protein
MVAKALYNWTAEVEDKHLLVVGETVTLSKVGEDYGGGWFEVIKDGRKGIVPSNYVRLGSQRCAPVATVHICSSHRKHR